MTLPSECVEISSVFVGPRSCWASQSPRTITPFAIHDRNEHKQVEFLCTVDADKDRYGCCEQAAGIKISQASSAVA